MKELIEDFELLKLVFVLFIVLATGFCCVLYRQYVLVQDKLDVYERWLKKLDSTVLLIGLRIPAHKLGDSIPPPPDPPASRIIKEGHAPPMPPKLHK